MKSRSFRFDEVTINYDKQRIPLSSMVRAKRQGIYRYYGAQGVIDHIDDYIFDGRYLLIAEDGDNLKSKKQDIAQLVDGRFWVNNHAHIVQTNELCDLRFLCYLINSMDLSGIITGSAQPKLSQSNLNALELTIPARNIQDKIVRVIGSLDNKIEVNDKVKQNLAQQAQVLFQRLCDDCTSGNLISLAELMDYAGGSQPPASEFIFEEQPGYIRFVQIRDYDTDSHITYIPESPRNKICEEHDIMIARYGASLGRICSGINGAYNVALAKVFPKQPYLREFLRCYLSSHTFYEGINNKGGRSAQAGFNQSDIKSFELNVPTQQELQCFEAIASALFEQRLFLNRENRKLTALRDTLLPRLMSGEIDVSNLEL